MEAFVCSNCMAMLQELSSDKDTLSLSQASRGVRQGVALHAEVSFEAHRGTMTWSEDGISGLCHFYPLSKLGKCLGELVVGDRRLYANKGRGHIQMHKEKGLDGHFLQSMQCPVLMESSNNMPFCKWSCGLLWSRRICGLFSKFSRGRVEHRPGCKAVESSEGYMLTLRTLSTVYFHLQGELIINSQKGFNMWHEIMHEIEGCPRYEGPVLCHGFEFDPEEAQDMMEHRWEGDFPQKCSSELVELYLEPHGECGVEVSFESAEDGFVVYVWLSKKTGDKEYEIISRATPQPVQGQETVDVRQACGDIGVYDPETSSFTILDQYTYFVAVDDDDIRHNVAWLPATWNLYPYVRDALISGRPLPMFLYGFEKV